MVGVKIFSSKCWKNKLLGKYFPLK
jgi:hypothetical protein